MILRGTMVQLHQSQRNVFCCWINVFENTLSSISLPTLEKVPVYLDEKIDFRWIRSRDVDTYSDLVGHFVKWPPLGSLIFVC